MTNDQLAAIRERRQEATIQMAFAMDEDEIIESGKAIMASLNDIPGMVAEIERLRGALKRIDYEAQSDAVADIAREALKEKPCKT